MSIRAFFQRYPYGCLPAVACQWLIAAVMLLAMTGCSEPGAAEADGDAKAATAVSADVTAKPVVRVTAATLPRKTLEMRTVQPASIEAFEQAPLYARVSAYVEKVLVDIGDNVKQGQVLLTLSLPEMQNEIEEKRALVAQGEAEVAEAQAAIRAAEAARGATEAAIRQAEAGMTRAEADYTRLESEQGRMNELAAGGSLSQRLADEATNQFRSADAARQEASAAIEAAKAQLLRADAGIAEAKAGYATAQARLRVAQAALARSETMAGYLEIHAPFDGTVVARHVDAGHLVEPSTTREALLVVARSAVVRVFADVPELEAAFVSPDDAAVVTVQSLGSRQFEGKVTRTAWSLDPANRSLRTEIDLPNDEAVLRPGMYATCDLLLERRENALAIPAGAIVREARAAFCYTVADGKAVRRPLELGIRAGDEYEVRSGLNGDETVVVAQPHALADGQPVEAMAPTPAK